MTLVISGYQQRILKLEYYTYSESKAGSGVLIVQHSQIDAQKECQTAKPRIKHPWWSELFTFEIFLECELIES